MNKRNDYAFFGDRTCVSLYGRIAEVLEPSKNGGPLIRLTIEEAEFLRQSLEGAIRITMSLNPLRVAEGCQPDRSSG